jgi:hypothetical protein
MTFGRGDEIRIDIPWLAKEHLVTKIWGLLATSHALTRVFPGYQNDTKMSGTK